MPRTPFSPLLPLLFLALTSMTPCAIITSHCTVAAPQVRAGFWSSRSNSYSPLASINASLFTHIYYKSLLLDVSTMQVSPPAPEEFPIFANFSSVLKKQNPKLKTLISISSIDHPLNLSYGFSSMAANYANRAAFIESSVHLARQNSFDGLDLAWCFPSSATDMNNLAMFLREWKARVDREAEETGMPPLLLSATVYFSGHLFGAESNNVDYPVQTISDSLDWVNTLSFGYHSDGDVTASDAALYDVTSHLSTSYGINSWLDAGLSPCKLVMGIPLYGRSWFLKNKEKYRLGDKTVAKGPKQKLSNQTGIIAYFEIEKFLSLPGTGFAYDNQTATAFFHDRDIWVSFDSKEVVTEKLAYVKRNNLLGYFLWPVSFDTPDSTISQLAMESWKLNLNSSAEAESNSTEQLQSPLDLPPHDHGSDISATTSRLRKGTSFIGIIQSDHHILLLLHFFYVAFFLSKSWPLKCNTR